MDATAAATIALTALGTCACARSAVRGKNPSDAVGAPAGAPAKNGTAEPAGTATYFISGQTSAARIEPVLQRCFGGQFAAAMSSHEANRIDFVWQNAATIKMKRHREEATVYSHLSNAEILEDKASLANLQHAIPVPEWSEAGVLAGVEVTGRTGLEAWCMARFESDSVRTGGRWVVKDAGANGAAGVWVIVKGNWRQVLSQVDENARLAMQAYVERPLLWHGRKVHLRCYALLFGDGSGCAPL